MSGGEAVRARVLGHVPQAQRLGVSDQLAQDSVSARERADEAPRRVVHAGGKEALQLLLSLVEDPERGVARPGHLARGLEYLMEHRLEIELGYEGTSNREQPL